MEGQSPIVKETPVWAGRRSLYPPFLIRSVGLEVRDGKTDRYSSNHGGWKGVV